MTARSEVGPRVCGVLKELNVTGCRGGNLTGDWLVLHATNRCAHITHIDTSWTNVNSAGLTAFSDNCHRSVFDFIVSSSFVLK